MNREIYFLTNDDMNREYGSHRRHNIGVCLKTKDDHHYYKQLESHMLHICDSDLINFVHNSSTDDKEIVQITEDEFVNMLRVVIFNLEIYKYCTPTDYNKN